MESPSRVIPINKKIFKSDLSKIQTRKHRYKTSPKPKRKLILSELWKGLTELFGLELSENSENLLKLFDKANSKQKNKLLTLILSKHIEDFNEKELPSWRKTIKGWIQNIDRAETRGAPVVPIEKATDFKEKAVNIINGMSYRCNPLFRSELIKILEGYHNESQVLDNVKPFNKNICSKHWLHEYLKQNLDIKEKWEAIPRKKRSPKKKSSSKTASIVPSNYMSALNSCSEVSPTPEIQQNLQNAFETINWSLIEEGKASESQSAPVCQVQSLAEEHLKNFSYLPLEGFNNDNYDVDRFFEDFDKSSQDVSFYGSQRFIPNSIQSENTQAGNLSPSLFVSYESTQVPDRNSVLRERRDFFSYCSNESPQSNIFSNELQ